MRFDISDDSTLRHFARHCVTLARLGDVVALNGPLGSGKTTFARAMITHMAYHFGVKAPSPIPSPTFTLLQTYSMGEIEVAHFDLYRIKHHQEVFEMGYEDALAEGICLIEWACRMGPLLPAQRLDIVFSCHESGDGTSYQADLHDWREEKPL